MLTTVVVNYNLWQVLRVIARNYLEPAYMVGLRAMFDTLDVSKTGILSVQDIITSLQEQGTQVRTSLHAGVVSTCRMHSRTQFDGNRPLHTFTG
jgi:hypothetical protein